MNRSILLWIMVLLLSCQQTADKTMKVELNDQLLNVPDSISIDDIKIKYLFKNQILANSSKVYDTLLIIDKVYLSHKNLWDSCYAMIFGESNAAKFNTIKGMVEWNRTLYNNDSTFLKERAEILVKMNFDSVVHETLSKFKNLVHYPVKSKISLVFTPITGILFGGCTNDQFCIELNNKDQDLEYTIAKGLPHELNHLAYDPFRLKDPKRNTALRQTIDEGFACYFTWLFCDKEITQFEAVENMTEENWKWYLSHEKELFEKLNEFFDDESGDNPLLRNDRLKLFPDAPKSLNYWIGFRIVERYVDRHGKDSWKDIYKMNVQTVFDQSGYRKYIKELK
jgi:uncharacterized protein YjaZ